MTALRTCRTMFKHSEASKGNIKKSGRNTVLHPSKHCSDNCVLQRRTRQRGLEIFTKHNANSNTARQAATTARQGQGRAGIPKTCASGLFDASAVALAARFRRRLRRRSLRLDDEDDAAVAAFPCAVAPCSADSTSEPAPVSAAAPAARRRRRQRRFRLFDAARLAGGESIRICRPEESQKRKGSGGGGGFWAVGTSQCTTGMAREKPRAGLPTEGADTMGRPRRRVRCLRATERGVS